MEQLHYGSPNGGRFTVIRLFSAAWSGFHVPLLAAFLPRCMLDASVERKVSTRLPVVNDECRDGLAADGTLQRRFRPESQRAAF